MAVARSTRAWIETNLRQSTKTRRRSHALRVRGLKRPRVNFLLRPMGSHALRVRGLKRRYLAVSERL